MIKAFDEEYPGNADYNEASLHVDGRQLVLELDVANTAANRKIVTKYAQCIGTDYVKHDGECQSSNIHRDSQGICFIL